MRNQKAHQLWLLGIKPEKPVRSILWLTLLEMLFILGCFTLTLLVLWIVNLIGFVFSGIPEHEIPDMAYFPKWAFSFALFALLGFKRKVREATRLFLERIFS